MLSPEVRTVAMDLLRPPPGRELDLVVLTTYTLDLEALLAVPLAVLAHADAGVDQLLEDPLAGIAGTSRGRGPRSCIRRRDRNRSATTAARVVCDARRQRSPGASPQRGCLPPQSLAGSFRLV